MRAFVSAIHTVCRADGWANVCELWPRARDPHSTKAEAEAAGRERAKQEKTEHVVHDADGTIERRTSYGNCTDSVSGERDQ
jgi:hypothetical protein